ncbi:MAG: hypothetical protein DWB56_17230 [Candidatus Jettenia sp.]|uniref:Uncharacterized protein n=1 Tax=Candidatus Jettenia caeni TaxID=247490 RepID=I3IJ93_9BACT|nr:MAG: hypothetical protein EDM77_16925 [Candidatus Jettenia sp. AMX1]MBC6930659.1 hypothetical protein [Candidatus Jettenia sp.]MCE7882248.1 hypothetical protein [Candidatus Jettenia sp. AMX1]MCQ3928801.1 hypothetical protein [Candidatus Jettenia sp.]GAB61788.1 hypothetical protein KSU1_C0192 [Candidatus Jettenia caeni]
MSILTVKKLYTFFPLENIFGIPFVLTDQKAYRGSKELDCIEIFILCMQSFGRDKALPYLYSINLNPVNPV